MICITSPYPPHTELTCDRFPGHGRPVPRKLAGCTLRAYHASWARVQSIRHGSTPYPIDMCQWGMGLPPCPNDMCQWGMGQQARAPLTRVIWSTSQSGTLHWASSDPQADPAQVIVHMRVCVFCVCSCCVRSFCVCVLCAVCVCI